MPSLALKAEVKSVAAWLQQWTKNNTKKLFSFTFDRVFKLSGHLDFFYHITWNFHPRRRIWTNQSNVSRRLGTQVQDVLKRKVC